MRSQRIVTALVVCVLGLTIEAAAQTPPPGDGWVVLPVDEYRALRERALPLAPPPPAPPVDATLTRIDYDLRAGDGIVTGRVVMAVDVLRDGWSRVQIPTGFGIRGATVDSQPLPLVNGPPPHVLLSRAGRSLVTLDVVLPVKTSAGIDSITLPPSGAPMQRARLALPRDGVELSAGGGFVADRTDATGESVWTALAQPNQALVLAWKRKVDDRRADLPLRTRARVTTLVSLGEETAQVTAAVRLEIVQGLAREVSVALPRGLVVTQVDGASVSDWDASGETLRVRLLDPVTAATSFLVFGESRVPREGELEVPLVRVPAAERESGGVAVDVAGAGEIGERRIHGLEAADPSELGEVVAGRESPSMIAFRLRQVAVADARSLTVRVVRYAPQAVLIANIEEARYRALAAEDGRLLVNARYAVRNNQRSFLKVTLPPRATLWSASVAQRPIRPGVAEQDAVLIPLEKGRAAEDAPGFVVELVYSQEVAPWSDKTRARVALPALDLPISRTGLELHYSPRFRVQAEPGAFRLESDPGPFSQTLREPAPPAAPTNSRRGSANLQALIDGFNTEGRGRIVAGSLPVIATFPDFGPSLFFASELTPEGEAPFVEITVRADKGSTGNGR